MSYIILLSMFLFALSMSISPGPVNMTILTISLIRGFWATWAFTLGATIGFSLLLIFMGFGFAQIFESHPLIFTFLAIFGALFIIYIGYKICISRPEKPAFHSEYTPNFKDGFLLQWLNPKAWIGSASGTSLFIIPDDHTPLIIFIIIYFFTCLFSLMIWGVIGQYLSTFLNNSLRLKIFNFLMGGSLILLALYMLLNLIIH